MNIFLMSWWAWMTINSPLIIKIEDTRINFWMFHLQSFLWGTMPQNPYNNNLLRFSLQQTTLQYGVQTPYTTVWCSDPHTTTVWCSDPLHYSMVFRPPTLQYGVQTPYTTVWCSDFLHYSMVFRPPTLQYGVQTPIPLQYGVQTPIHYSMVFRPPYTTVWCSDPYTLQYGVQTPSLQYGVHKQTITKKVS